MFETCIDSPGWRDSVGNGKVVGWIPGQGTYLGCGSGHIGEATNQCFPLTLMFISLLLSLKAMKK